MILIQPRHFSSVGVDSKDMAATPQSTEEDMEVPEDVLKLSDIPQDFQKGWWRITSQETIRQILLSLNARGIRERNLQKQFHKHLADTKELLKTMPNGEG